MLRIQAERDFSLESELALDFAASKTPGASQQVVLAAILRERIEQLTALALAAGLKLQAITSTALALSAASQLACVLYCSVDGAELAAFQNNGLPVLRRIASLTAIQAGSGAQSAGELRYDLELIRHETPFSELTVWNDSGSNLTEVRSLADALGIPLKSGQGLKSITQGDFSGAHAAGSSAVALCHFQPKLVTFDFLHSRMAIAPAPRFGSRTIRSVAIGGILLLAAAYFGWEWQQNAAELSDLRDTRKEMKVKSDEAKDFILRMNAMNTWYDKRPNYMECLRALTLCFPEDKSVWIASLSLREDFCGVLTGNATDKKGPLEVFDKLKKTSSAFKNVKLLSERTTGNKAGENTFAISFSFHGVE